ncbi:hypothetical protein EC973_008309 [Apophysomyces ossiformis]|uniref:Vacuolar membrane protein n=1 Tax=Apophysomyces ossiformis TaxID=679940 RepID=A0A8H7BYN4_9FUNG|nr:hypothetical protein EC973_008309 [Apophysomyces ossiformis]
MCGDSRNGPKWKREVVQEHSFDYVDLDEFYDGSCSTRFGYIFVYVLALKSILVYAADLYSGVSLLVVDHSQDSINNINNDSTISTDVAKWIFLGAILVSFLLLFWDIRKARNIIASRDISYAFTNVAASRYYSIKDYKYYCLFCRINKSRKTIDDFAFFVFFTLKGWKRLLLAEAPRQVINIMTLKALIQKWIKVSNGQISGLNDVTRGYEPMQKVMTGTMAFSVIVFAISFILVCIAAVMYIPLLCHIQGNLKEYCCHKVDKRISEILKKQARKRVARNQQAAQGKIKGKKDMIEMKALPKPTLPNVDMDDLSKPTYHPPGPRANYHPYPPEHAPSVMASQFHRRNSESSLSSDQVGLIKNSQAQPWSSNQSYYSNAPQYYGGSPYSAPSPQPSYAQDPRYYQQYNSPYSAYQPNHSYNNHY